MAPRVRRAISSRRQALLVWLASAIAQTSYALTKPTCLVVSMLSNDAIAEAIEGIRAVLAGDVIQVVDLQDESATHTFQRAFRAGSLRVLIAVGAAAHKYVIEQRITLPIISTMLLRADILEVPPLSRPAASVHVDVALPEIIGRIQAIIPGRTRVATLGNPSRESLLSALGQARSRGLKIENAACTKAEELIPALLSLRGKADWVVCLPDTSLYNSATITPLLRCSLENRLPIVGYSANFVRAGAAAGIYANYRDLGAQTAELAQRILSGAAIGTDESPRRLVASVNQRVMRLLGLNYDDHAGKTPDFVVLR